MFEDISIASVGVVVSESEGVSSISICPPWVRRSSWSSSVSIVGGLLRMSFGCRARVWRVDLFLGHLRDVAMCGPLQFAHLASWCSHGSVFLPQPSALHLCLAPSCPSAQTKDFASSTHLPNVEDCRTRASRPPQTHCRYKAVDGPSSRYTAYQFFHTQFHHERNGRDGDCAAMLWWVDEAILYTGCSSVFHVAEIKRLVLISISVPRPVSVSLGQTTRLVRVFHSSIAYTKDSKTAGRSFIEKRPITN